MFIYCYRLHHTSDMSVCLSAYHYHHYHDFSAADNDRMAAEHIDPSTRSANRAGPAAAAACPRNYLFPEAGKLSVVVVPP
jgi:hypothetical protein